MRANFSPFRGQHDFETSEHKVTDINIMYKAQLRATVFVQQTLLWTLLLSTVPIVCGRRSCNRARCRGRLDHIACLRKCLGRTGWPFCNQTTARGTNLLWTP